MTVIVSLVVLYFDVRIPNKLKGLIFFGQVKIYSFIKFKNCYNFDGKSIRLNFAKIKCLLWSVCML